MERQGSSPVHNIIKSRYRIELKVIERGFTGTIGRDEKLRSSLIIETEDRVVMRDLERWFLSEQKKSI